MGAFFRKGRFFTRHLAEVLVALLVVLFAFFFVARPFQVKGASMFPSLESDEYILLDLVSLRLHAPRRGDILVFISPTDLREDFVKRVVGLPGERIRFQDGNVLINDVKLDESAYLPAGVGTYGRRGFLWDGRTYVVPGDSYLVLGDNRYYSSDSRSWGFLKRNAVLGMPFLVYWPPHKLRVLSNP